MQENNVKVEDLDNQTVDYTYLKTEEFIASLFFSVYEGRLGRNFPKNVATKNKQKISEQLLFLVFRKHFEAKVTNNSFIRMLILNVDCCKTTL